MPARPAQPRRPAQPPRSAQRQGARPRYGPMRPSLGRPRPCPRPDAGRALRGRFPASSPLLHRFRVVPDRGAVARTPRAGASRATPAVRIRRRAEGFSTDPGGILRPQLGDGEVVQTASTGPAACRSSRQVRWLWNCGRRRSTDCGRKTLPQGTGSVVHRRPTGRPPLPTAHPHPCPLFGNETPGIAESSERRHTKELGWAVGNWGKAGDSTGEKYRCPVHRVCTTSACPQKARVVHEPHPQHQWTKNRP